MTASVLNISTLGAPAAAQAGGLAPKGAAAGFELMLAALFGDGQAIAADPALAGLLGLQTSASPQATVTQSIAGEAAPASDDAEGQPTDAEAAAVTPDAALALIAAMAVNIPQQLAPLAKADSQVAPDDNAAPRAANPVASQMLADLPLDPAMASADASARAPAKAEAMSPVVAPQAQAAPALSAAPAATQPAAAPRADLPAPVAEPVPTPTVQPASQPAVLAAVAAEAAPPIEAPAPEKPAPKAERPAEGHKTSPARAEAFAEPRAARPAQAIDAAFGKHPSAAMAEAKVDAADAAPEPALAKADDPTAQPVATIGAPAQASAPAAQAHAGAVRGSPETVAALAAQIVKKLEGRTSRFDLELHPADLGRVDVRLEINHEGRLTAAMAFDTPQAAAELKARAGELQKALEQAGFDLSGGMSFDVAGDQGRQAFAQNNQDRETGSAFRGRAFQAALDTAGEADIAPAGNLRLRQGVRSGVDVRI